MATTSGASAFNIDIPTICEEAFERAGLEMKTGYDLKTARRSLAMISLELSNRGINLFQVTEASQALTQGTATYSLGSGVIDVVEHMIRKGSGTSQVDYRLERISVSTFAHRSNKNIESRPTDIYVNRQTDGVSVTLWPTPDDNDWTLAYWYLRRIEDLGVSSNNYDSPERFIPAICAGLAYNIAMKRPEAAPRLPMLEAEYEKQLRFAFAEDREKADVRIVPGGYRR